MTDKERGILADLRKKARAKTQKCYNPNCNNLAIRSHIQQAEGSIRDIASADGKIIQLEDLDPRFNDMPYAFKEKGIKQKGDVLTFWGFCNSCDTLLFKSIEAKEIDFSLYKNQLLYSYRGFLSELYKQEYNIKWYELIFKSNNLSNEVKESFSNLYNSFLIIIKMSKQTKFLFEQDLNGNTRNFDFIYLNLPKLEVCTSTSYTLPVSISFDADQWQAIKSKETIPLINTPIFINLIPKDNQLNTILGCISDKTLKGRIDVNKIERYNQKEQIKLISDILIKHVETWFVSKTLYNLWTQRKLEKEILKQIKKYRPAIMKRKNIKFNMFQDII
ncbi:hypothetical protein DFQ09_1203 [Winogradskyella pacifica]|uniref:Uncharacterized protein n=1 Tax=Winogradskyella pacifica TaxID=664642 RepID=A0A3D9LNN2_9FLAO|nr:hypothetical protein [Winogradskyella pacifica]REE07613.1 hypothetical protein DFQ09_1203 [Winogradskyella pacifica]